MEFGPNPALILVDVQRGMLNPEGTPGMSTMSGTELRLERIRELTAKARDVGVPVVFVQEVHKPAGTDFGRELDGSEGVHAVEGDPNTELVEGLEPRPEEYLIQKRRYSAFFATELDLVLRNLGIETVILVGGLTDVCIHYTSVDAHQHDYYVHVVTDCVGGSSPEAHDAALRAIHYLQHRSLVTFDETIEALESQLSRI